MHLKAATAILAFAYTATAATLPSGLVLRAEDQLSGLMYPRSELEWTGVVVNGTEPMTLYGPIESIIEQAKKINPDFQFEEANEADELETRALEARNRAHIICNIGGTRGVKARPSGLLKQRDYLKSLKGKCGVNARSCARVSCSYKDAVWLCNDNYFRIAPRCDYLAGYVTNIINKCTGVYTEKCQNNCKATEGPYVNGQQFDTDHYNVIVGHAASC